MWETKVLTVFHLSVQTVEVILDGDAIAGTDGYSPLREPGCRSDGRAARERGHGEGRETHLECCRL